MDVSRRYVDKLRLNIELYNTLYPAFVRKGLIPKLNREQEDYMLDYIRDRLIAYLSEVQ